MIAHRFCDKSKWLPNAYNQGFTFVDVAAKEDNNYTLIEMLSRKYQHSSKNIWMERISTKRIFVNGKLAFPGLIIKENDTIEWERPSWEEESVPAWWDILYDNGDILIINKPSGLPVTPGGGFMKHTLLELMRAKSYERKETLIPKPIHRLGRFTSGIIICAREKETRARLSSLIRNSSKENSQFLRVYRARTKPNEILVLNQSIMIKEPICQIKHKILGKVWSTINSENESSLSKLKQLSAITKIKVLEKSSEGDLVEVIIFTGRPHQIRIHLAYIGTPLRGDKLYLGSGRVSENNRPGEGGYFLHAHKIINLPISGCEKSFEAPLPKELKRIKNFET